MGRISPNPLATPAAATAMTPANKTLLGALAMLAALALGVVGFTVTH